MKTHKKILILFITFGVLFWVFDSIIDMYFFNVDVFVKDLFTINLSPHEIYMRLLVSSILIIMGYFIYRLTRKTDETLHQLDDYKEHLITILNSIGDAVIACDTEQRIIGMNPISEKLTGWKESEASGKQLIEVFNIINEYTHEKAENPVEKVLKEGKIVGLANHTALISKDGRILSIADAGSPIIDKEGAIKGVVLIFRDVTDERKAQRELEESELRFRSVISNIYEGIAVTDETGTIIEWNKRMEQIHGLKREEVIGKKQWELQDKLYPIEKPSDGLQYYKKLIDEVLESGSSSITGRIMPFNISQDDGSVKYCEQYNFSTPHGDNFWLASVSRDITDQKLHEEKLTKSEYKFSSIFKMTPDLILIRRISDGLIMEVNTSFVVKTRYERDELIGHNLNEFNFWIEPDEERTFYQMLSNNDEINNYQTRFRDRYNNIYDASISASKIDLNGDLCTISYIKDITDRVQHEKQMAQYMEDLEQHVRERTVKLEQANIEIETINQELTRQLQERLKAEYALKDEEEKFRTLVNQLPVGVYRTTLDGKFLQSNPALANILGFENTEELSKVSVFDLYPKFQRRHELLNKLKAASNVVQEEIMLKKINGELIWVRDTGKIIYNDKGEIEFTDGIIEDITGKKVVEEALKESEERYRTLFEKLHDIFFRADVDGNIIIASPSAEKVFGYNPEELTNLNIFGLVTDEDLQAKFTKSIKTNGKVNNFISELKKKDDSKIYLSIDAYLYRDNITKKRYLEGIARDITSNIKYQNFQTVLFNISKAVNDTMNLPDLYARIHESLEKLVDTKNFFIALYNKNTGKIVFPRFVDVYDDVWQEIHVDDKRYLTPQVIKSGESLLLYEDEIRKHSMEHGDDGGRVPKVWLGIPLKLRNQVIGAIGLQDYNNPNHFDREDVDLLQSIADQIAIAINSKQATLELKYQYDFMQRLIDTIPNPVYYKDAEKRLYIGCNKAYTEYLNISKENVIGNSVFDIFPADMALKYDTYDMELLYNKNFQQYEDHMKLSNGSDRFTRIQRSCYYDNEGNVIGYVGVVMDLTDIKIAEQETNNALKKEKELNELKLNFISMVSHEYRTPLQAIIMSTQLLSNYSERLTEQNRKKYFDIIGKSVKTMDMLLDDIITYNKSEIGKIELLPSLVDIEQFCLSFTYEMLTSTENKCPIDLTINNGNYLTNLDQKILHQVLSNVLSNAIKYSEPGKAVIFDVDIKDLEVEFTIIDNGIGISEEDQKNIFDPFFRGRNVGNLSGTGLGLAIAKNSVEAHGGKILFESRPGSGTTFRIIIPYYDQIIIPKENPKNSELK